MKRILSRRAFLQGSAAAGCGLAHSKTIMLEAKWFPREGRTVNDAFGRRLRRSDSTKEVTRREFIDSLR